MAHAVPSESVYLHLNPQRTVFRTRGASLLELVGALFAALQAAAGNRQRAARGRPHWLRPHRPCAHEGVGRERTGQDGGEHPVPQPPLPVAADNLLRKVKEAEQEFVQAAQAADPRIEPSLA